MKISDMPLVPLHYEERYVSNGISDKFYGCMAAVTPSIATVQAAAGPLVLGLDKPTRDIERVGGVPVEMQSDPRGWLHVPAILVFCVNGRNSMVEDREHVVRCAHGGGIKGRVLECATHIARNYTNGSVRVFTSWAQADSYARMRMDAKKEYVEQSWRRREFDLLWRQWLAFLPSCVELWHSAQAMIDLMGFTREPAEPWISRRKSVNAGPPPPEKRVRRFRL